MVRVPASSSPTGINGEESTDRLSLSFNVLDQENHNDARMVGLRNVRLIVRLRKQSHRKARLKLNSLSRHGCPTAQSAFGLKTST